MSAGPFSLGKYERDNGDVHPISVQPETTEAEFDGTANGFLQGAGTGISSDISAQVAGSKRSIGLHARKVAIRFGTTAGSFPAGYKPGTTASIPVFQKSVYDAIKRGDNATYLGVIGTVTSKLPEIVR